MRKRLIGKAFAIAMSGAMVLTATPVTANIFNVATLLRLLMMHSRMNGHIAMLVLLGLSIGRMKVFIMLMILQALM